MATFHKLISKPAEWVSAHRKNEFKIKLPQTTISSGVNSGGYLKLNLAGAFYYTVTEGDRIYIPNLSPYTGFHTIREVVSSVEILLETSYVSNIGGSVVVWQVVLPEITIYKGYTDNELILPWDGGSLDLYDIQPYTLVATFAPEVGLDGYITFDICGYLKTVIATPYKGFYNPDETDYSYPFLSGALSYEPLYYNKVRLVMDGGTISEHYAANSALSTDDLNRFYVNTSRELTPLKVPVLYFGDYETGDYITSNKIIKTLP